MLRLLDILAVVARVIWRKIRNSLPLLVLAVLVAANAWALEEICGNGYDDASSGYTYGSCPAGWMNAVYSGVGCDLKCPVMDDGCHDDDNDGFPTCGTTAEFSRGSATVNGAQASVGRIIVDAGHDFTVGKYASFYDSISAGTVEREVLGATYNSITIDGAVVTVADNAAITAVAQVDCDDTNRRVWPGKYRTCGTDGTQLCQTDGTWSSCSEGELCEATGSGDCYYIDPVSGSNSNNGQSRATAWANQKMFAYYSSGSESAPAGHHTPVAGDVYYFMDGTNTTTYNGGSGGDGRILTLRGRDCTRTDRCKIKAYPGENPVFSDTTLTYGNRGFYVYQGDWWQLEGFEVDGAATATGAGIYVFAESSNNSTIEVRDVICHERTGDKDNLSCLRSNNDDDTAYSFRHNDIWDTNGNSGAGGETEIGIWRGSNHVNFNTVHNSATMPNASDLANHCIFWKHCGYNSMLHFSGNTFWNCGDSDGAAEFCGPNLIGRFNRLIDSDQVNFAELGGISHQHDITWQNNTQKNSVATGGVLGATFQRAYNTDNTSAADACSGSPIERITFTKNILSGTASDMLAMNQYSSDLIYADVVTGAQLSTTDNTYDNGGTVNISLFATNNGDTTCAGRGNNGASYTLASFQSSGLAGAEAGSRSGTITWNEFQQSTDAADCGRGWRTNCNAESPTPTPTPSPTPPPTISAAHIFSRRIR